MDGGGVIGDPVGLAHRGVVGGEDPAQARGLVLRGDVGRRQDAGVVARHVDQAGAGVAGPVGVLFFAGGLSHRDGAEEEEGEQLEHEGFREGGR